MGKETCWYVPWVCLYFIQMTATVTEYVGKSMNHLRGDLLIRGVVLEVGRLKVAKH
jgi:hypothetical protein